MWAVGRAAKRPLSLPSSNRGPAVIPQMTSETILPRLPKPISICKVWGKKRHILLIWMSQNQLLIPSEARSGSRCWLGILTWKRGINNLLLDSHFQIESYVTNHIWSSIPFASHSLANTSLLAQTPAPFISGLFMDCLLLLRSLRFLPTAIVVTPS